MSNWDDYANQVIKNKKEVGLNSSTSYNNSTWSSFADNVVNQNRPKTTSSVKSNINISTTNDTSKTTQNKTNNSFLNSAVSSVGAGVLSSIPGSQLLTSALTSAGTIADSYIGKLKYDAAQKQAEEEEKYRNIQTNRPSITSYTIATSGERENNVGQTTQGSSRITPGLSDDEIVNSLKRMERNREFNAEQDKPNMLQATLDAAANGYLGRLGSNINAVVTPLKDLSNNVLGTNFDVRDQLINTDLFDSEYANKWAGDNYAKNLYTNYIGGSAGLLSDILLSEGVGGVTGINPESVMKFNIGASQVNEKAIENMDAGNDYFTSYIKNVPSGVIQAKLEGIFPERQFLTNTNKRTIKQLVSSFVGEGSEEAIQNIADRIYDKIANQDLDSSKMSLYEIMMESLNEFIVGGAIGATGGALHGVTFKDVEKGYRNDLADRINQNISTSINPQLANTVNTNVLNKVSNVSNIINNANETNTSNYINNVNRINQINEKTSLSQRQSEIENNTTLDPITKVNQINNLLNREVDMLSDSRISPENRLFENGAKVFIEDYGVGNNTKNISNYESAFNAYYKAGKVGIPYITVKQNTDYANYYLSDSTLERAYQAGVEDGRNAYDDYTNNSKVNEQGYGVVTNDVSRRYKSKNPEMFERMEIVAKNINAKVEFLSPAEYVRLSKESELNYNENGNVLLPNGFYNKKTGVTYILETDANPLGTTLFHEFTHRLEQTSNGYEAYANFVLDFMKNNSKYNDLYKKYEKVYNTQKDSIIKSELIADFTGRLSQDEAFVKSLVKEHRPFAEKLRDFYRTAIKVLTGKNENINIQGIELDISVKDIKQAEKLLTKAMNEADAIINNNAENEIKYSIQMTSDGISYVKVDTDQNIFDGIKRKDYNKIAKMYFNDYLLGFTQLGENDKVLIDKIGRNKFTNPGKKQQKFKEKMLLTPELKNILKIANKISESNFKKENYTYPKWEYYLLNFDLDNVFFKGIINIGIDENGKKHFYEINEIYEIKEINKNTSGISHEANSPAGINNIITQEPNNVKNSIDSEGNTLSKEQIEFFKDSKARDKDGNLLVVFHGSKNRDFNKFIYDPNNQTGTDYGKAFYFTSDLKKAKGYSYNVEKDQNYIDLEKEYKDVLDNFLNEDNKIKQNLLRTKLLKILNKQTQLISSNENYSKTNDDAFGDIKKVYLNLVNPLIVDAKGTNYHKVYENYFTTARNNGNDGIIVKNVVDNPRGKMKPIDVYIAFNENQIKNVDNTNPTLSDDIRYSLSDRENALENREKAVEKIANDFGMGYNYWDANFDYNDYNHDFGIMKYNDKVKKKFIEQEKLSEQEIKDYHTFSIDNPKFKKFIDTYLDPIYKADIPSLSTDELNELSIDTFGTTDNYEFGAYMLSDGQLLNFNEGGYRKDHQEINNIGYTFEEFIDAGNIRMIPEANGFMLSQEPTREQYDRLKDFLIKNNHLGRYDDHYISIGNGRNIERNMHYGFQTNPDEILSDISYYFKHGDFPHRSWLDEFRYSKDSEGKELTKEQIEYFKESKVRDDNGNLKVMYHGTKRVDRVGNIFDPNKATSGPMAFFTDNQEIANGYSKNKNDTSLSREYDTEYDLYTINNQSLDDYWNNLSIDEKNNINKRIKDTGLDEDYNVVIKHNASYDSFGNTIDYYLRDTKNNGLKAVYKIFLEDFNINSTTSEGLNDFKKILDYVTNNDVELLDPYSEEAGVYEVYINVTNPFYTTNISKEMFNKLNAASKKAKIGEQYNADMWDKSNVEPKKWMETLKSDIDNNTTYSWTMIPDWVTNVLKENGYDGIIDEGGKHTSIKHTVVIPFYSNQIKNIDNTKPTETNDIRFSKDTQGNELSAEQIEYYKNVSDRLRNSLGRLTVLHHYTSNTFTSFDIDSKTNQGHAFGDGIYLAIGPNTQYSSYGNVDMNVFANITNPIIYETETFEIEDSNGKTNGLLSDKADYFFNKYFVEEKNSKYPETTLSYIKQKLRSMYGTNELIKYMAEKNNLKTIDIYKDLGYDGLISYDQVVAFEPSQVKSIYNTNPTESNDIRYSVDENDPWKQITEVKNKPTPDLISQLEAEIQDLHDENVRQYYDNILWAEKMISWNLCVQKEEYNQRLKEVKDSYKEKIANNEKEFKERIKKEKEEISRIKKTNEVAKRWTDAETKEKIKEIKEQEAKRLKETIKTQKEKTKAKRTVKELKESITKGSKELSSMLLNPTDKKHIPENFRNELAEFLSYLDFSTDRQGDKRVLDLMKLHYTYLEIQSKSPDADLFTFTDGEVANYNLFDETVSQMMKELNGKRIADMDVFELSYIDTIIKSISTRIKNANKIFLEGRALEISEVVSESLKGLKQNADYMGGPANPYFAGMSNMLRMQMLRPVDFFETIGLSNIYSGLRKSYDDYIDKITIAKDFIENNILNDKQLLNQINDEKLYEFQLENGQTISLTKGQLLTLYNTNKREQARGHIYGFGIKPADAVVKSKEIDKQGNPTWKVGLKRTVHYSPTQVTINDVNNMINSLSEKEKQFADNIMNFFNTYSKDWINETTLRLYGYEKATAENYFPIFTDSNFLDTNFDVFKIDPTINNWGSLKATQTGAKNAIIIKDILDIFTEHVSKSAMFGSFAESVDATKRVINYKSMQDGSIKDIMDTKFGHIAFDYLKNFMFDVQAGMRTEKSPAMVTELMKMYKASVIGANLRSVVQQPTAITKTLAYIDPKYLTTGIFNKSDAEEMYKYSRIARYKHWGFSNMDIGRDLKSIMLNERALTDWAFEGLQVADDVTWGKIWNACKLEIADKYPELLDNKDDYLKAVANRFDYIIDKTQVVDSVFHKADVLRQKDGMWKVGTAFMSEPTSNYSMFISALYDYKKTKSEESLKQLRRSTTSMLLTGFNTALTCTLYDMLWRNLKLVDDDDDDEAFLTKLWKNYIDQFASMIPFLKDVISYFEGYKVERMEYQGIARFVSANTKLMDYCKAVLSNEDSMKANTLPVLIKNEIASFCDMIGIPVNDTLREIDSAINVGLAGTKNYSLFYSYNTLQYNPEYSTNKSKFMDILWDAYKNYKKTGDSSDFYFIKNDLEERYGYSEKYIQDSLKNREIKDIQNNKDLQKSYKEYIKTGDSTKITKEVNDLIESGKNVKIINKALENMKKTENKSDVNMDIKYPTPEKAAKAYAKGDVDLANQIANALLEKDYTRDEIINEVNAALEKYRK